MTRTLMGTGALVVLFGCAIGCGTEAGGDKAKAEFRAESLASQKPGVDQTQDLGSEPSPATVATAENGEDHGSTVARSGVEEQTLVSAKQGLGEAPSESGRMDPDGESVNEEASAGVDGEEQGQ